MIDTVIFDLDGVLCRYDLDRRLACLSDISGRPAEDIHRDIWQSGFEDKADAGEYRDSDAYLAAFAQRLQHPISRAQWIAARRCSMTTFDGMLAIAGKLKTVAKIAILTNNVPLLRDALGEVFPPAPALFGNQIYFSCDFGVAKPDPALFRLAASVCGTVPENCMFTDDKASNVQGARQAGMTGIQFTGEDKFVADLAQNGVTV